MKRQDKRKAPDPAPAAAHKSMGIDEIVATLSSFKDLSKYSMDYRVMSQSS